MNRQDYFDFHADFCRRMQEITQKKNRDYAGDGDDPFANFRVVEKIGVCSVEQGFLTRMSDKFIRMVNLSDGRDPAVVDESLEDTILDLANYCALLAGYLRSKKLDQQEIDAGLEQLADRITNIVDEHYASPMLRTGKCWEIIATSRSGDIVLESCVDAVIAATRLEALHDEWPTFKLRIEESEYQYEVDGEHPGAA